MANPEIDTRLDPALASNGLESGAYIRSSGGAMPLTQEAYDHYWTKGRVVVEDVFSREEAEGTAEVALAVSRAEMRVDVSPIKVDRSEDGRFAPRKIDEPFLKHAAFREFVLDERLLRLLTTLLGQRPVLARDQILMKPPGFGSAKPYHQDNYYFRLYPSDHVITAWLALDDVDEENGCLRYIDGSHKGGILPHQALPGEPYNLVPATELIDLSRESPAPVRQGGVVFHHSQTLHTSHRNHSDRWRRGYATHWVIPGVTCETNWLEEAYFRRSDFPGGSKLIS